MTGELDSHRTRSDGNPLDDDGRLACRAAIDVDRCARRAR
jgi:hypothetical protein